MLPAEAIEEVQRADRSSLRPARLRDADDGQALPRARTPRRSDPPHAPRAPASPPHDGERPRCRSSSRRPDQIAPSALGRRPTTARTSWRIRRLSQTEHVNATSSGSRLTCGALARRSRGRSASPPMTTTSKQRADRRPWTSALADRCTSVGRARRSSIRNTSASDLSPARSTRALPARAPTPRSSAPPTPARAGRATGQRPIELVGTNICQQLEVVDKDEQRRRAVSRRASSACKRCWADQRTEAATRRSRSRTRPPSTRTWGRGVHTPAPQ
jgi:hypothetical protein